MTATILREPGNASSNFQMNLETPEVALSVPAKGGQKGPPAGSFRALGDMKTPGYLYAGEISALWRSEALFAS